MVAGGGVGEGIVRELGKGTYTLLYLKWITNKDLLYSTGNSLNVMWQLDGREVWGRMDTYIHVAESLRGSPETTLTLFIGYTQYINKNFKV